MTFYGAAAMAYHRLGVSESAKMYDKMAAELFDDMLLSLQNVPVADEPNPVKVNWYC